MIKNGLYAQYDGKEYAAAKMDAGHVKLIDPGEVPNEDFTPTPYGNFIKIVGIGELDSLTLIKSYAVCGSERFEIISADEDGYMAATSDAALAERWHMKRVDRGDFRGRIPTGEVQRIEEDRTKVKENGKAD